jgi:hypothetical protein
VQEGEEGGDEQSRGGEGEQDVEALNLRRGKGRGVEKGGGGAGVRAGQEGALGRGWGWRAKFQYRWGRMGTLGLNTCLNIWGEAGTPARIPRGVSGRGVVP